ncbi:MAG: hypothetical protein IT281_03295, partial [Ignavibacteria bacterium]|nr:hypothetical protein [Ignavibacteria bacterium]
MKKSNKNPIAFPLALVTILTALSVAAYIIFFNSGDPVKVTQSNYRLQQQQASHVGPIKFTSTLDNNYYFENNSVYLYLDLQADELKGESKRTPLNIS